MQTWRALMMLGVLSAVSGRTLGADLQSAGRLLQTGKTEAAIEAFRAIADADSTEPAEYRAAVLGLSRAYQDRGLWDQALEVAEQGLSRVPQDPSLLARLAELEFLRGRYESAERHVKETLARQDDHLLARLVKAHLNAEQGRHDEAIEGYVWFVRYYNRAQPTDAESLLLVAEGAIQYARWKSVSSIFNFVVNTLCVDALADDPLRWEASLVSGELLLEKYNNPQARAEFETALAVNPQAARVIVAQGRAALLDHETESAIDLAQRALKINPRLPEALRLAADASVQSGEFASAMKFVDAARQINPVDQRTLARLAGICLLDDGLPKPKEFVALLNSDFSTVSKGVLGSRFAKTYRNVLGHHPKPGVFLADVGAILDAHRKYEAAEFCYRRAIEVMPQLSAPRTALGMLAMRTGDLDEARSILDAAFKADPFHVRVSNMRKVLDQLQTYAVVTSDHFVVRVPEDQRLLGEAMTDYLERTYVELTATYGFEPETRTQFEVFGASGETSAHGWFSARMVGLPWVQTIGASTGMIVAMASPVDSPQPFNWARVLRHEFVHILTLQQTRFNIPHWYTEALAVRTEGATPPEWDAMLLRRVPAGDVFTLGDLNAGFQRPENPEDWQMAYCQSWLYAEFVADRFGEQAHARLLDAYRDNLSTEDAISRACGVELTDFEDGYSKFLEAYVQELSDARVPPPLPVDVAQQRWRDRPTDRAEQAELAWAMWQAARKREALQIAERLQEDSPGQPLAVAVVADSMRQNGQVEAAGELVASNLDVADPHPALLVLLARVRSAQRNWSKARELWQIAVDRWPREPGFLKGLTAVVLQQGDDQALQPLLERLAALDADDRLSRMKLASLASQDEDWDAAIRWAGEALHVDVTNESMHRILAEAYEAIGETNSATREREILRRLQD